MKIGELFVQLGFQSDDAKLKDFVKAIGDLDLKSAASVLGLSAAYEAIRKVMEVADQVALSMYRFSQETGMSAQKMQQWSNLAGQLGVSAEDVVSSVKRLEDGVARMRLTGEGAQGWMLLGIDPTTAKDSFELLSKVREAIKNLSPEYQRLALQQVGLSESMLSMMKVSDEVWNSSSKLITNSKAQEEAVMRNYAAWAKLKGQWNVLVTDIGAALAPLIEKIAQALNWIVEVAHKFPWIQQILIAVAAGIGAVTLAIGAMTAAMAVAAIVGWISGLSEIALVIGLIAAGLTLIVLNWEKLLKLGAWLGEKTLKMMPIFSMLPGAAADNTTTEKTNPFPDFIKMLGMAIPFPGAAATPSLAIPEMNMPGISSSKTSNNRFTFHITGNNPEEIANKVDEKIQRMFSDGEYQTKE